MLMRILATGLLAGLLAGSIVSGLQHFTTTPLILKAETYEKPADGGAGHAHGASESAAAHEHGSPAGPLARTALTSLATVSLAIGFAFMLLAVQVASGVTPTARAGLAWAAAAFTATGLAPALGLPPELPGSAEVDLVSRQVWWLATAAATGGGLWLLARSTTWPLIAAGVALLVAPHIVGAPHTHEFASDVPAEIASRFAAASLVVHALLWVLVGTIAGYLWQRMDSRATA